MKSKLLERLSKEKPENNKDEIKEALKRGYSLEQIMKALEFPAKVPTLIIDDESRLYYMSNRKQHGSHHNNTQGEYQI